MSMPRSGEDVSEADKLAMQMAEAMDVYNKAHHAWEEADSTERAARGNTTASRNRMADALKKVDALRAEFDNLVPKEAR